MHMSFTTETSEFDLLRSCEAIRVHNDDILEDVSIEVPVEHVVDVFVNDQPAMILTCTPSNIEELVLGRLFTEGLIDDVEAIESLVLENHQKCARVLLKNRDARFAVQEAQLVDTCGPGTRNLMRGKKMDTHRAPQQKRDIDSEQIFFMARVFAEDTPLHTSTWGVHSCSLFRGCELLYSFEDLGRHNAFDKAVGAALADGVNMTDLAVLSSGRIPVDMVAKALRSRIPLLVTKATPTTRSVGIARAHGLMLVGRARPDSFCVFAE